MLKLVIAKKKSYLHVGPQNRAQNKVVNRYENIPGDLNFDLLAPDQNTTVIFWYEHILMI